MTVFVLLLLCAIPISAARAQAPPNLPPPNLGQPGAANPKTGPNAGPNAGPGAGDTASAENPYKEYIPDRPPPSVTMTSEVGRVEVPRTERLHYIVKISWDESADQEPYPLDFEFPVQPEAPGLTLVGNSFRADKMLEGNTIAVTRTYTFDFYAETEGKTEIAPMEVGFGWLGAENKEKLSTQPIKVTVTPERIRPADLARSPITWAAVGLVLAGAAAYLVRGSMKKRSAEREAVEKIETPADRARRRLREADKHRLAGDYGEYFRGLSFAMLKYAEEGPGVKTRGGSAAGSAEAIAGALGAEWKDRLLAFAELADKVKFAGHEPGAAELDRAMETARKLVEAGESLSPGDPDTAGNNNGGEEEE